MQAAGGASIARRRAAIVAIVVIASDQLTKAAVAAGLAEGESKAIFGDVLRLTHVRNTGAAFGMLQGFGGILALAALVGVIVFAAVVVRRPPPITSFGAALVAAGAMGNLIDRVVRDGGVVDFVDFRYWPAFNVADSAITVGALLLLWAGMKEGSGTPSKPEPILPDDESDGSTARGS